MESVLLKELQVITAGLAKISSLSFGGIASTVAPVASAAPTGAPEAGFKKGAVFHFRYFEII